MGHRAAVQVVAAFAWAIAVGGGGDAPSLPSSPSLLPSSHLQHSCYNFPAQDFSTRDSNCVRCIHGSSPHLLLAKGDAAIDFTLPDYRGNMHTLSDLLKSKPVLLIWGMYTCPAYQGLRSADKPFDQCSYAHEYEMIEKFKDAITFVHLYGPEPHPNLPYTNFDSGKPRINYWSTVEQPRTWTERLAMVEKIAPLTHPDALLLVDYLPENPFTPAGVNNPVWCSYAHASRAVVLIGKEGTVQYTRDWFQQESVEAKLTSFLKGSQS